MLSEQAQGNQALAGEIETMTYFVEHADRVLWVATMPYGTTDLIFARKVAASISGAFVSAVRK